MLNTPPLGRERDREDPVVLVALFCSGAPRHYAPVGDAEVALDGEGLVGVVDLLLRAADPCCDDVLDADARLGERAGPVHRVACAQRLDGLRVVRDPRPK
jgi:hypothetical protein